jgi:hemerythrin-like metal-binding protein
MKLVQWQDELHSLGVPRIDQEHRRLMVMVANVQELAASGSDFSSLSILMNSLVEFIEDHFFFEEYLMSRFGFEHFEEHRQRHSSFLGQTLAIHHQYIESDSHRQAHALTMANHLAEWLDDHLHSDDSILCEFLRPFVGDIA